MRVLITGAGLVGSHLAQLLARQGDEPFLFELRPPDPKALAKLTGVDNLKLIRGDVTNLGDLVGAIQEVKAECVAHTAALLGGSVDAAPYTAHRVNVDGTINVMEAARLTGVKRVVYTSTQGVYNWTASAPMTEDQPFAPKGLYAATKLAAEHLALAYGQRYGVEAVIVRYAIAYGYNLLPPASSYGSVIHQLMLGPIHGRPVAVTRTQPFLNLNEFVYVKDMVRGIDLALKAQGLKDHAFNIGTGEMNDLADIASAVRQEIPNAQIAIEEPNGPLKPNPSRFPCDLTRSEQQLGYRPQYRLEAGIRDYIATMRACEIE